MAKRKEEIPHPDRVTPTIGPFWVTGVQPTSQGAETNLRTVSAALLEALSNLMDYLADPANPKPGLGLKNVLRNARAAIEKAQEGT